MKVLIMLLALAATSFTAVAKENLETMLIAAANKHDHVTPELLAAIGHIETGFRNVKNKKSSAAGVYQFTQTTWKQQLKTAPKSLGVSRRASVYDVKASTEIAAFFTQQNADFLKSKLRRPATHGELYIMHLLGPSGGLAMIKAPKWKRAADVVPDAVAGNRNLFVNKNGQWISVSQFRKNLSARVERLMRAYAPKIDRMERELYERELDRQKPWRHWLTYAEIDFSEINIEYKNYVPGHCNANSKYLSFMSYCNHWPERFKAFAIRRKHVMSKI